MKVCFTYNLPETRRLDHIISAELEGRGSFNGITRAQIKRWIMEGRILVDGRRACKAGQLLKAGARVEIEAPDESNSHLEPYDFPLAILFEDAELLVIDKPAGLTMHPGAGNKSRTLLNALLHYFQGRDGFLPEVLSNRLSSTYSSKVHPGIVHRLDRDTSGVVVVAKTRRAHSALSAQFAEHTVKRAYYALVFSTPRAKRPVNFQDSGTVIAPLGRHPSRRTEMAVNLQSGRQAATHWKVLERMHYGALVELRLETGRTHQVRVHMNHIGSPVIGDKTYGDFSQLPPALKREQQKFGRQALHGYLLEFEHPGSGKRLSFMSPMPEDMQKLIAVFRVYE